MKNKKGLPICGKTIEGPSRPSGVVLWRKQCRRRVKQEGDRCYQHCPVELARRPLVKVCGCGELKVGGQPTGQFNWNPDCAVHGVTSEWYRSPEQVAKREAQDQRLRDLQAAAREARRAIAPRNP